MANRGVPELLDVHVGEQPTGMDFHRLVTEMKKVTTEISINRRPQLSSEILEGTRNGEDGIALVAGQTNLVEHGLRKAYRGWKIVRIFGPAMIYELDDSTADRTKFLPLGTTQDVTIYLEVF